MSGSNIDILMELWAAYSALQDPEDTSSLNPSPFSEHGDMYRMIDAIPIGGVPVKTQGSELRSMGRVPGFGVSECRTYGCRGQRCSLNLCVSPSLPELVCLCILEGQSYSKGSE